jgi:hypothetical protein
MPLQKIFFCGMGSVLPQQFKTGMVPEIKNTLIFYQNTAVPEKPIKE